MIRLLPNKEYSKKIIHMSMPAIAGLSTQMVVSLVDAGMVGRLDNAAYALAAMGVGVLATWVLVSFFSSLSTGTHILVARNYGAKNYQGCNDVLFNSVFAGFILGALILLFGLGLSEPFAQMLSKDSTVGKLAGDYIFYRFLGIPFFLITVSFRGFFFGIGSPKIFMLSGLIVNLLNIFFNYMFIYGEWGFPEMGLAGAGFGSTIATVCDVFFYLIVASIKNYRTKFNLYHKFHFSKEIVTKIVKLAMPVSLQNVFIVLGFLFFISVTGLIGITEQAAAQAIISTLFISFLPCYGFGIAVQTLVGIELGKGDKNLAKIYGYETAKIATIYTLTLSIFYLLLPEYLLMIITLDQQIIRTAVPAIKVAGVAQIFYAAGIVLANALQALGKTSFVMFAEVFTNLLLFVPFAYLFGVVWEYGLVGAWFGLPIYVITYATIIFVKFKNDEWVLPFHL